MSLVRSALKKLGISFDDFWAWAEEASKGEHKALFDAYERALADTELAGVAYDLWLKRNWQKADFSAGMSQWERKQKRLRDRAMGRLGRIFEAYKKDQTKS